MRFANRSVRCGIRQQACKSIRDAIAILFECRILAGELVFTAAAFYGLYHLFRVLIR
jgi:hypothetical protein